MDLELHERPFPDLREGVEAALIVATSPPTSSSRAVGPFSRIFPGSGLAVGRSSDRDRASS